MKMMQQIRHKTIEQVIEEVPCMKLRTGDVLPKSKVIEYVQTARSKALNDFQIAMNILFDYNGRYVPIAQLMQN